jgi:hypothetical protein
MAQGQHRQSGSGDERRRRAAEERQIAGAINSLHRDYNAAQKKARENDEEHIKWNRRTAKAAICYSVLTGLLLGAAGFSVYQAWSAIGEASRAADAATNQANVAADTEERQLRAYLYVLPGLVKVEQHADGSIRVTVKPTVKVFGQTPAGMVLPMWDVKIGDYPIPANFPFVAGAGQATAVITPGQDPVFIAEKSLDLAKDDVAALKADKKRVYQAGTVAYVDVFGKARYTNFCRNAPFDGLINGDWEACPIHNGADWYSGKPSGVVVPHD